MRKGLGSKHGEEEPSFGLQYKIRSPNRLVENGDPPAKTRETLLSSRYEYRQEILTELAKHGLRPTENTPPEAVREALVALYLYEIRRLRDRLKQREFPKSEYAERVDTLRRRYPLLGIPFQTWTLQPLPDR
jgi:hypothetical protein